MSFSLESSEAQLYVNHLGNMIARFAENSSRSKNWCLTLLAATLAFALDKKNTDVINLSYFLTGLFFILDSYYLSLERAVIAQFNDFTKGPTKEKLFDSFNNGGLLVKMGNFLKAMFGSFSTTGFYGILFIGICLIKKQVG